MNDQAKPEVAILKTSEGEIVLRFFDDIAPGHVANFKKLSREDFYNGTKFHRVIKGFMIQGGCPNTKESPDNPASWGTGGPNYQIDAEFNDTPHVRGTLSMARSQDPNSAGSQFFICHGDAAFLNNQYTAFGEVLKGLKALDAIATAETCSSSSGEQSSPANPVELESVTVISLEKYNASQEED